MTSPAGKERSESTPTSMGPRRSGGERRDFNAVAGGALTPLESSSPDRFVAVTCLRRWSIDVDEGARHGPITQRDRNAIASIDVDRHVAHILHNQATAQHAACRRRWHARHKATFGKTARRLVIDE
eukprot:CAMPEP_0115833238 /NCGR_PEP_ID=MMETSP0287-20121206/3068_1 /TAXON_ID=412157 /ORGANISM="Chrysochromulina rotalis, Strain UIO044" /LENGTH=125 /DNA_ID=CAMNT_0003286643 /DNA_START=190 /DNA_END=566 /DNA_ORIENTATION=-